MNEVEEEDDGLGNVQLDGPAGACQRLCPFRLLPRRANRRAPISVHCVSAEGCAFESRAPRHLGIIIAYIHGGIGGVYRM